MFFRYISVLFFLTCKVYSQQCVTYDLEENINEFFINEACDGSLLWNVGYYEDGGVEAPNDESKTYVYPNPSPSCISSRVFPVDTSGKLEVNVFMDSVSLSDEIRVIVRGSNEQSDDMVIGDGVLRSNDGNFVITDGLFTINVAWVASGLFDGYVVFSGTADEASLVLIDSLRYIPQNIDDDSCSIYNNVDNELTSTTATTLTESESETIDPTGSTQNPDDLDTNQTSDTNTSESLTSDEGTSTTETTEFTNQSDSEDSSTSESTPTTTQGDSDDSSIAETFTTTTAGDSEVLVTGETIEGLETTTHSETIIIPTGLPDSITTNPITTDDNNEVLSTDSESSTTSLPVPTQSPVESDKSESSFWTPVTITSVTIISAIILALVSWFFYDCGRNKTINDMTPFVALDDLDRNFTPTMTVPRVNQYYSNSLYAVDSYK